VKGLFILILSVLSIVGFSQTIITQWNFNGAIVMPMQIESALSTLLLINNHQEFPYYFINLTLTKPKVFKVYIKGTLENIYLRFLKGLFDKSNVCSYINCSHMKMNIKVLLAHLKNIFCYSKLYITPSKEICIHPRFDYFTRASMAQLDLKYLNPIIF
jgi:hypothetical protein